MIETLIKDIEELISYKEKYEHAIADKKTMSDKLYEYMLKEWESMGREERVLQYKENCRGCRHKDYCSIGLPEDIGKPIPSEKAWIPARVSCGKFEWS